MIKGKNINLRQYKDQKEIMDMYEIYNDLSNRSATDHTEIYSAMVKINRFKESGLWNSDAGELVITDKSDKMIGTIGFKRNSEFELGIGYRINCPEERGKGYMTEALKLFSVYLFETIPFITRLCLYTAEDNIPSRKLAEKCGYVQEGVLRKAYFYRGKICNWIIYSLLREEAV